MSATENLSTPLAVDTHLAELHTELSALARTASYTISRIYSEAGARREYTGRNRREQRWSKSFEDCMTILEQRVIDHINDYKGREAAETLRKYETTADEVRAKELEIEEIEKLYTGWSRFFLVTSSTGHIHSSTHCSTCRFTTTFGWMPQLSGKTEADAVKTCGPALCSVCFPSAPTEHQMAKLSKKQVEDLLAGKTITQEPKKEMCPGSGKYFNRDLPHRTGYAYGNSATCEHCRERVSITSTGKIRAHKPKA